VPFSGLALNLKFGFAKSLSTQANKKVVSKGKHINTIYIHCIKKYYDGANEAEGTRPTMEN